MTATFTELEVLLFLLCCFMGWRLYIKQSANLLLGSRLVQTQALVLRIARGQSRVVEGPMKGHVTEVVPNHD